MTFLKRWLAHLIDFDSAMTACDRIRWWQSALCHDIRFPEYCCTKSMLIPWYIWETRHYKAKKRTGTLSSPNHINHIPSHAAVCQFLLETCWVDLRSPLWCHFYLCGVVILGTGPQKSEILIHNDANRDVTVSVFFRILRHWILQTMRNSDMCRWWLLSCKLNKIFTRRNCTQFDLISTLECFDTQMAVWATIVASWSLPLITVITAPSGFVRPGNCFMTCRKIQRFLHKSHKASKDLAMGRDSLNHMTAHEGNTLEQDWAQFLQYNGGSGCHTKSLASPGERLPEKASYVMWALGASLAGCLS